MKTFCVYVQPEKEISAGASKVNKFTVDVHGNLLYKGQKVKAIHVTEAIRKLIEFIDSVQGDKLLIAHNGLQFDFKILNKIDSTVLASASGLLDSLLVFRKRKFCKSSALEEVHKFIFGEEFPDSHDALQDSLALKHIFQKIDLNNETEKLAFHCSLLDQRSIFIQASDAREMKWREAVAGNYISSNMAKRAALSGLVPDHLVLAYDRAKEDGVEAILQEKTKSGDARVASMRPQIDKIIQFIKLLWDSKKKVGKK